MADIFSPEKRSDIMSKIRNKNTRVELIVRKWLFSFGYRFRINDKRYPGTPDIVLPKYRTAIFIHGCFWHHHINCKRANMPKTRKEFWVAKFERNIERDRRKMNLLEQEGWNVIIIWECEIYDNFDERLIRLLSEIRQIDIED